MTESPSKKQPFKTDVAVLMLFFNRPDSFGKVFEEVRKARPSHLFLYQDGPRGERDMAGIMACRKIAEHVDWECDVRRNYQERNYGCDPSEYMAQKWAFSMVDKCIVLEDDDVPSQSFFPFCKEMLDRYEHDPRVWLISGFNIDEQTSECPYSYFFSSAFSIWGWASWRRVIDTWDETYAFLDDSYDMRQLEDIIRQRGYRSDIVKMCRDHRAAGKAFYETIFWASMLFNNALAIFPQKNLINNIGVSDDSTHFSAFSTTPRGYRRIFTMRRLELDFPLRHPKHIIDNVAYKERLYRVNAWGHPLVKIARSFEELFWNLCYGNFKAIAKAIGNRLRKWTGSYTHK